MASGVVGKARIIKSTGRMDRQALLNAFRDCADDEVALLATVFGESRHSKNQKLSPQSGGRPIRNAVGKIIWDRVDDNLIVQCAEHERSRREKWKKFVVAVVIGLVIGFLIFKFGWNG